MIAKIKTRVDFGGIVNYANDQKNKKKCAIYSLIGITANSMMMAIA